jgi:hypothetical protein
MLMRLRQLDFENSGLITADSLITIANTYNMQILPQDLNLIRQRYRRTGVSGSLHQTKVEYQRVLQDLSMSLGKDGKLCWVFAPQESASTLEG